MVRHGEGPDPKANMMYPGGLGRVISGELFRKLPQLIIIQFI